MWAVFLGTSDLRTSLLGEVSFDDLTVKVLIVVNLDTCSQGNISL